MSKITIGFVTLVAIISATILFNNQPTRASINSKYDPTAYVNQLYATSNVVDNDNWSRANGAYLQLGNVCRQIGASHPELSSAVNDCINGVNKVVSGSICNGNCHTAYNISTYGPVVDSGLRLIDSASLTLAN